MHAWLDNQQLDGLSRLWQGIRVEAGWEDALEAVLRERLNGIALDNLQRAADWLDQPPPGKVSFFQKREGPPSASELAGRRPLLSYITFTDPSDALVLSDWLDRVYVVPDAAQGLAERASLPAGAMLVCPQGHVFTRNSVNFHASDSEVHGILSRQRDIEQLREREVKLQADVAAERAQSGWRPNLNSSSDAPARWLCARRPNSCSNRGTTGNSITSGCPRRRSVAACATARSCRSSTRSRPSLSARHCSSGRLRSGCSSCDLNPRTCASGWKLRARATRKLRAPSTADAMQCKRPSASFKRPASMSAWSSKRSAI